MADRHHISSAIEDVSLHLEAINLLGDALSSVIEDGGSRRNQYGFCLAFRLLAEAAQTKLETIHEGVRVLVDDARVSREVEHA